MAIDSHPEPRSTYNMRTISRTVFRRKHGSAQRTSKRKESCKSIIQTNNLSAKELGTPTINQANHENQTLKTLEHRSQHIDMGAIKEVFYAYDMTLSLEKKYRD